jgi:hypothetical protein
MGVAIRSKLLDRVVDGALSVEQKTREVERARQLTLLESETLRRAKNPRRVGELGERTVSSRGGGTGSSQGGD